MLHLENLSFSVHNNGDSKQIISDIKSGYQTGKTIWNYRPQRRWEDHAGQSDYGDFNPYRRSYLSGWGRYQ
jgi:hypothetical protein